ncbi:recombinase family protein [Komagataeibacter nataicola]|uniref:recombinase family protein n=1 Tax=Komagataeibacter nataicola TaxID=265960 RepID=UPI0023DD345F|nr:recombinase family protein [Komagataeibacter nataicola]WEQ54967.1 recombinase family protein [Komagataeibacter nataicola]
MSDGRVDELQVGFRGTMNALFLRDLAEKTHRGLRGRVEQGRSGGGLAYGYDVATDQGEVARQINEREAAVIRRIFRSFADGQTPGRIAVALNAEDICGPRNRLWSGTTIRGHRSRGTGIINNELYRGVLVWNRQRYLKDPQTGRRLARPNPPESWIRTEVPELRIVSDALWQAVQLRQDEIENRSRAIAEGVRIAAKAREQGLLPASSGLCRLLACGLCGGEIIHVGRQRYGCAAHARKKACDNRRTVERRVMDAEIRSVLEEAAVTIMLHAEPLEQETQAQGDLQERRMERERQELVVVDGRIQSVMTAI